MVVNVDRMTHEIRFTCFNKPGHRLTMQLTLDNEETLFDEVEPGSDAVVEPMVVDDTEEEGKEAVEAGDEEKEVEPAADVVGERMSDVEQLEEDAVAADDEAPAVVSPPRGFSLANFGMPLRLCKNVHFISK